MERVNKILQHSFYKECMNKNQMAEQDRRFCGHTLPHLLDVARIAMILNLEQKLEIPKELIYAAALLHDIGRFLQYENGTPHELASGEIAPGILEECGFDEKETLVIISAILTHRQAKVKEDKTLNGILYTADKMSRCCFFCEAIKECDWKENKKNNELVI